MVVSNYCTFSWSENLYDKPNEEGICFSFYDKISSDLAKLPFVLFSSYSQRDERLQDYMEKQSFFYVDKDEISGLSQIKSILNAPKSQATKCSQNVNWADFKGV